MYAADEDDREVDGADPMTAKWRIVATLNSRAREAMKSARAISHPLHPRVKAEMVRILSRLDSIEAIGRPLA